MQGTIEANTIQANRTNQPTLITKDIKNFLDELDFVFGSRSRKDTLLLYFLGDSGGGWRWHGDGGCWLVG